MRLDNYLVKIEMFDSRTKAKQAIERGEIYLNSKQMTKVAFEIDEHKKYNFERIYTDSFVSLGGFKLKKALVDFDFSVKDLVVCDVGASTGGFTDCLLKNGAKKVYAVDLNDQLLHDSLKQNNSVVSIIKNAKEIVREDFAESLDLIVADLSFISLSCVIKVFSDLLDDGKKVIVLIKPQFESGEKRKFKNGIVKDKDVHFAVCKNTLNIAIENNLTPIAFTTAPICEGKNVEFLALLEKNGKTKFSLNDLKFNIYS